MSCCGDMAAFTADASFLAAHLSPEPLAFHPKVGKSVHWTASDGKQANGFYVPGKKGNHGAILVVHEFWGLNDYIRRLSEDLRNNDGYSVLAVDLYDGKVSTDAKQAAEYMRANDPKRSSAIIEGALKYVKATSKATKIGTLGFCFGGGWSFKTAVIGGPQVQACVMYYGMPDTSPEALSKLHAPVLMIHAKQDQWITQEVVDNFFTAMNQAHKKLSVLHYDAVHAFANPSNPKYVKAYADDAMKHTEAFYKSNFGF
jgi:carboxymethylenebutenolidase